MSDVLRVCCMHSASHVVRCALTIKAGTRNESVQYNGMAHLVEHMLFKGTLKRDSKSINDYLEKEGGELNAYTTKEEIVIYSTVMKEDFAKAADLLLELAFTSQFPQKELDKERSVIYDEIISYKDSPAESIYDHFETLLFSEHPLHLPILGEKKSLMRITPQLLSQFIAEFFIPSNMVFSIVGDITEGYARKCIDRSLARYYKGEAALDFRSESGADIQTALPENSSSHLAGTVFSKEVMKRNHQAHCIIGAAAYSYYDGWRRNALTLLCNILGGPASNSRLNMLLRERYAMVYNIEASYTPYTDTGIFSIYFGCDKALLDKCRTLVYRELEKMCTSPLSETELKKAKKQFLGQLHISHDNAESQVLAAGKSLLVYDRLYPLEYTMKLVESITSEQLLHVAKEVLCREHLSELVYR